ncbi:hypothetical protein HZH66_004466 [Vespula vulgaris]|uniref:Uncharacterized protein n=1 Tax=Vespula vulgaris TaxID=7454 RepID=A0A834NE33_VESVU|nr:hypothetical protein HZH66_004466 [Vespula vulgaris]
MNTTNIIDPLPNKEPYDDLTGKTYGVRRSRGGSYENVRFTVACPFSMEKKQDTKGVRRSEEEKEEGEEEDEEEEEEEEELSEWRKKKKKKKKRSCGFDRQVATSSHGSQRDLARDLSNVFVETKSTRRRVATSLAPQIEGLVYP